MSDIAAPQLPSSSLFRPVRLATLVRLRWLAVAGQLAGVLFVSLHLGYPLPLTACLALIGLSVVLNLFLILRYGAAHRPGPRVAAVQLGFDSLQLAGLLFLTGGLENPFSLLLLAPVSVSATTLPRAETALLALFVAGLASALALVHYPLPWDPDLPFALDRFYIVGIWVSLMCGVAFISAYTNRVAHEARQLADAVAATELALSRQQQLSALDGLAAAAAHELGTPLATIALAAKEMRADVDSGPLAEDVDLILEQTTRCRTILSRLRNLESGGPDLFAAVPLHDLIAEVARPYEGLGKTIRLPEGAPGEPVIQRNVGLLYGLGNLIENAVHFAGDSVQVATRWDADTLVVAITDDGPGFPVDLLTRIGEPYLTTRPREKPDADPAKPGGMGLGVFIAKTLLERTGAQLSFTNVSAAGHARVTVTWRREALAPLERTT